MSGNQRILKIIKSIVPFCLCSLILLAAGCSTAKAPNSNTALSANSQNSDTQKPDLRISLFDGRFSFVPPDGFKLLPAAQIKRKLPDNAPRDNIYSNESQTAYMIIEFGEPTLKPEELPEIKKFVEGSQRNYFPWTTSEMIEMNGRKWFHFEWEKPADDGKLAAPIAPDGKEVESVPEKPVYYRSYTTSLNQQLFRVSFEADSDEYPKVKEAFDKTIQTIQTKD